MKRDFSIVAKEGSKEIPKGFSRKVYLAKTLCYRNPVQMILILFGQLVSGLSEGVGIMSMVIVIKTVVAGSTDMEDESKVIGTFMKMFETVGLPMTLGSMLTLIVLAVLIKSMLQMLVSTYVQYVGTRFVQNVRLEMIEAVSESSWPFFVGERIGRFANALNQESTSYQSIFINLCSCFAQAIALIVYLVLAVMFSWELTIAIVITGLFLVWMLKGFIKISERTGYQVAELNRSMVSRLTDVIQGIKSVKSMGLGIFLRPLLIFEVRGLRRAQFFQNVAKLGLAHVREPIVAISAAAGIFASVSIGNVEPMTIIGLLILFQRTTTAVGLLQGTYQTIGAQEGVYFSFSELLDRAKSHREPDTHNLKSHNFECSLVLRDVSFSHEENSIVESVNAEFPKGSLTTLVGLSGAGKTTILDMICGLYQPDSGQIIIGKDDLAKINLQKWRESIGYVEQDSILFHDSISVNVSLNDPSIDEEQIIKSLTAAGALDFVMSYPRKLDTVIGERGLRLSGGQRQRLAIARALARSPDLLLLDEATTSLDPETEQEIVQTLRSLMGQLTIIAVSHQQAITDIADHVFRLENRKLTKI